ncbi:MAG: protein kinase [Steroidobacteraceae bacterium]|nr:protein kinase [Steroidobacteraceae bacterium]
MDDVRWQRVKELFSAALEQEPHARSAFLDAACGGDAELRAELDSLLASHDSTGDFIETPAAHRALGLAEEREPQSWIGRRVGDYRIVEEVGRGGMSEVYKGVRDDDEYHKEVAIKVLRRDYGTRSLLKRFKVEVQILATLDHPNIARLLDAGSTEDGLPYLVMDYIEGQPIDEYCSTHRLGLTKRLELFRALCTAVQYVHQHLMVHGDLKCSNVLVSSQGTVKLLDFGIARLLNPTPALNVADQKLTSFVALTPEYASPEQVRGGAITTASDVYSLGVMLYRLLTGVLPHRVSGEFSYDLATQILHSQATPPSVAARQSASADIAGFARQLRGDLDNIILMALEKDPARRYASVEALEEDIRRHLDGFPVRARAAGYFYQLSKFAGRHKAGIAAVSLLIVTLAGGIIATSYMAREAFRERERAERHFNEVRKLANTLMFDFHGAIQNLPGATPARQMLVENSLKYLEALSAESGNEPALQRELAAAYEKVGDVQGGFRTSNLGDIPGAISSYRKALSIRESLSKAQPEDRELRRELLRNYGKLSEILAGQGDRAGSMEATRALVKLAQALSALPDATLADRRNFASALGSLGFQLSQYDQAGDGLLFLRQAIAMYEALLQEAPEDFELRRLLSIHYERAGEALMTFTSNYAEALRMYTKGLEISHRMAAANPQDARLAKQVGYAMLGAGSALMRLGRPGEAAEHQANAVTTFREALIADPKNDVARFDAALALEEAGASCIALNDLPTAERRFTEALAALSSSPRIASPEPSNMKTLLGVTYFRLGQVNARRAARGRSSAALQNELCSEARRWFDLSAPILEEAETFPSWHALARGKRQQIPKELAGCTDLAMTAR